MPENLPECPKQYLLFIINRATANYRGRGNRNCPAKLEDQAALFGSSDFELEIAAELHAISGSANCDQPVTIGGTLREENVNRAEHGLQPPPESFVSGE